MLRQKSKARAAKRVKKNRIAFMGKFSLVPIPKLGWMLVKFPDPK